MTAPHKVVNGVEVPLTDEDLAQIEADAIAALDPAPRWQAIREQRNAKLAACDWTQLSDAPVDASVWAEYRQALRDITAQSDPFDIVWPDTPEA